jgi:hypothetical protein
MVRAVWKMRSLVMMTMMKIRVVSARSETRRRRVGMVTMRRDDSPRLRVAEAEQAMTYSVLRQHLEGMLADEAEAGHAFVEAFMAEEGNEERGRPVAGVSGPVRKIGKIFRVTSSTIFTTNACRFFALTMFLCTVYIYRLGK